MIHDRYEIMMGVAIIELGVNEFGDTEFHSPHFVFDHETEQFLGVGTWTLGVGEWTKEIKKATRFQTPEEALFALDMKLRDEMLEMLKADVSRLKAQVNFLMDMKTMKREDN